MSDYTPITPERILTVDQLYSVHYFEYSPSYKFFGERHDFWEFLYVDKGSLRVIADEEEHSLSRGQIIFHAPGEFHALSADGVVAPNIIVVSFRCDSPAMSAFRKRITVAGAAERVLLARIVDESTAVFSSPLNDPATYALQRRTSAPVGGEQLLVNALEELLIRFLRQESPTQRPKSKPDQLSDSLSGVIQYLEQRLDQPLTVDQICRDNTVGRSQLQKQFHEQTGSGVMDYFGHMKIKAARQMIREGRLNFTQIAEQLGFQSVHYFSRRFRHFTGMSPSEYAESVKMLSEQPLPKSDNRTNNV